MSLRVSNNNGYTIGYDDGINYADGRVNTNSINYQSGYNSGISYADSRVNESSINYSTGYNNGINYADGRVNESSVNYTSGYNIGYSKGKNVLSTLTSGELFLLYLMKYNYNNGYGGGMVINEGQLLIAGSHNPLYADDGGMRADLSRISNVTYNSTYNGIQTYNVNGDNTNARFVANNISPIISFTTKDGKEHTADNFNY